MDQVRHSPSLGVLPRSFSGLLTSVMEGTRAASEAPAKDDIRFFAEAGACKGQESQQGQEPSQEDWSALSFRSPVQKVSNVTASPTVHLQFVAGTRGAEHQRDDNMH